MRTIQSTRWLIALLVIFTLALSACGGGAPEPAAEAPAVEEAAPTEEEAAPTEEPAEAEAAPTEEPAEEEASDEAADADVGDADVVVASVDEYLSNIPEGWMSVGDAEKMQEAMDNGAFVIDVREEGEYAEGHIPGAINIPLRTLAQNLDKIPTDQPIVTYCASGHRAGMGLSALRMLGYNNAKGFPGSWRAWTAADGEVEMEPVEAQSFDVPEIDAEELAAVDGFLSNNPEGCIAVHELDELKESD